MLQSIYIKNYVLIEQLEIDFSPHMTVFTGETGAGKSITIGALSLALGARGDTAVIGAFGDACEVVVTFDVSGHISAQQWLKNNDFEDDNLMIRRTLNKQGRSQLWINGSPTPAHLVKELGRYLVQIHGQHDQIKLLQSATQRQLLDRSGHYKELLTEIADITKALNQLDAETLALQQAGSLSTEQQQLLDYQYQELHELDLKEGEYEQLHQDLLQVSHAQDIQQACQQTIHDLDEADHSVRHLLAQHINQLKHLKGFDAAQVCQMLDEALINVQEAVQYLTDFAENIEHDPGQQQSIEQRLEQITRIARKQNTTAEQLTDHQQQLAEQLNRHQKQSEQQSLLDKKRRDLRQQYHDVSLRLTQARQQAAKQLAAKITAMIQQLGLPEAQLSINVNPTDFNKDSKPQVFGLDHVEFMIAVNKGQSPQPLSKTASGGELSRICLAIEVVGQNHDHTAFVFDEVDTGIGGATASKVGGIMRNLSEQHQVFAVTHLPQVAGQAHDHILVSKSSDQSHGLTRSAIQHLNREQRIQELARMAGGETITETTLAQAEEFLKTG
ncbi:DNA repair protein RecN [Marinicella pacifica]|uniref:DNA repair protein RecN n=1 Tax=Marinicella pacifica TaxID=1171543 RepID=A0A917CR95_9GAMM|nr:DNA repair protein RecN [Marinicella pacifica]GGF95669.1 DNA repair protein RecN [Marinicella pacifica]